MESGQRLARGPQLASQVYRSIPREEQVYALFKEFTSRAVLGLKERKSVAEVLMLLRQLLGKEKSPVAPAVDIVKKTSVIRPVPSFSKQLFQVRGRRREKVLVLKRRLPMPAEVPRE
jgi:hypothetical protein